MREDLERLKKIRLHRGLRTYWGLRVRGQHTKVNTISECIVQRGQFLTLIQCVDHRTKRKDRWSCQQEEVIWSLSSTLLLGAVGVAAVMGRIYATRCFVRSTTGFTYFLEKRCSSICFSALRRAMLGPKGREWAGVESRFSGPFWLNRIVDCSLVFRGSGVLTHSASVISLSLSDSASPRTGQITTARTKKKIIQIIQMREESCS